MEDSFVHAVPVALNEKEMLIKEDKKSIKEDLVAERKDKQVRTKKVYAYDEVIRSVREYFGGDDLAAKVWASKYALKDSFGNLYEKSPDDMHRRLASEIPFTRHLKTSDT